MSINDIIKENKDWINRVFILLDKKMSAVALRGRNKLPYFAEKGVHVERPPWFWTAGFWGGLNWLMYEATGNVDYKLTAERSELLLDKAFETENELHHDVGFMFHLTAGASCRLTKNQNSFETNLKAATMLKNRFNKSGRYIRSWNGIVRGDDSVGLTIIDGMMNLALLYWASEQTGDKSFYQIAKTHAEMTQRDHVREDLSVCHVVVHNPETGEKIAERAGQGYSANSAWARGQSWAVYGFTISYLHTKEQKYLQTAKLVADEFIKQTQATEWLPRLDFRQPETPLYYDSSAGAITACGLIELSKITSGKESEKYLQSAINMLKAIENKWCDFDINSDGLLMGCSESYAGGRDKNLIYGDFFFVEAMCKLKQRNFFIW